MQVFLSEAGPGDLQLSALSVIRSFQDMFCVSVGRRFVSASVSWCECVSMCVCVYVCVDVHDAHCVPVVLRDDDL